MLSTSQTLFLLRNADSTLFLLHNADSDLNPFALAKFLTIQIIMFDKYLMKANIYYKIILIIKKTYTMLNVITLF